MLLELIWKITTNCHIYQSKKKLRTYKNKIYTNSLKLIEKIWISHTLITFGFLKRSSSNAKTELRLRTDTKEDKVWSTYLAKVRPNRWTFSVWWTKPMLKYWERIKRRLDLKPWNASEISSKWVNMVGWVVWMERNLRNLTLNKWMPTN